MATSVPTCQAAAGLLCTSLEPHLMLEETEVQERWVTGLPSSQGQG